MKAIIISLSLFAIFALVYAPWGDYYSDYWNVSYYVASYFWMTCALWFIHLRAKEKISQYITMLFVVYFGALLLLHVACLFSPVEEEMILANGILRKEVRLDWYQMSIPNKAYFNVGTVILTIGILYLRYKFKKPCRRVPKRN